MKYHLIVYVPVSHADKIRETLALCGAGRIGNYDGCSFSVRGIGRFRPLKGANPFIGAVAKPQVVDEERIEAVIGDDTDVRALLKELHAAHPYEEPAIHILPMADEQSL